MSRPSGPDHTFVSVWNASEWTFERWFGAMNGWVGAGGAKTGCGVHGSPVNVGGGSESGVCGIGAAAAAGASASSKTRTSGSIGNTLSCGRSG